MSDSDGRDSSDEQNFLNCLSKQHVVLPKCYVLQAIDSILQPETTKPADEEAKSDAEVAAKANNHSSYCMDKSLFPIFGESVLNKQLRREKYKHSLLPIMSEMRHCLLAGDWDGYKELLLILFKCPNLSEGRIVFCIRSCFVLLFNHPKRTAEMLDNFIACCLRINEQSKRIQYLQDCFTLKTSSAGTSTSNAQIGNNQNDSEEEEEMFFNSDFSSD